MAVAVVELPQKAIHVGEMHASAMPTLIRTLLGSCIAACLHDPVARVGGMNHFLLPHADGATDDPHRFGVHAMEELVFRMQRLGADRRRLVGKIFGGGHVLPGAVGPNSVPSRNIHFIEEFMVVEQIPVASRDLGGREGRVVLFESHSGRAFVRKMRATAMPEIMREELRIKNAAAVKIKTGEVTLF